MSRPYIEIRFVDNSEDDNVRTLCSRHYIEDAIDRVRAFAYAMATCLEGDPRPYQCLAQAIELYAEMNDCDPCFNDAEIALCEAAEAYLEPMRNIDQKLADKIRELKGQEQ